MKNVIALFGKPSLCALRKTGTLVRRELKDDPERRRVVFNEVVRVVYDEPTPAERNPEIRKLVILIARQFDRQCAMENQ